MAVPDLDLITQAVQLQYEDFPYPPIPIDAPIKGFFPMDSYILGQYARTRQFHSPQDKRFLVAGCGTGHELHGLVSSNPGYQEVIGIDISRKSIEIANQRIAYHQLSNATAQLGDILNPATWPAGDFDMICSYGVIHHTADPLQSIRNLAARLKKGGVMGLMLYNRSGRWQVYRIRQAMAILGIREPATENNLKFVMSLLKDAGESTFLGIHYQANKEYYEKPENVVDNFFHAQDIPFDIGEIPEFLEKAGLEFLDVAPQRHYWDPKRLVSPTNKDFHDKFQTLSRIEQLTVQELLDPFYQTQNIFWCCRQGENQYFSGFDKEWFKQTQWRTNPMFLAHGGLEAMGDSFSFESVYHDPHRIPKYIRKVDIIWPLCQTPEFSIASTRYQVIDLLLPLTNQPKLGAELLQDLDSEQQEHHLSLFKQWEKDRIILAC
ncbi:MAG: class I SAM-dependent methyltransferase [Cyanobacteriota bacterium]|nr:class I SAM-dependent methyltransferase [Cyanobacteriota bacterium]